MCQLVRFGRGFTVLRSLSTRKCFLSGSDNSQDESTVFNEKVRFVELSSVPEETDATTRELPLFLLSNPFFPEGITNLNIFEMKYRTMMFDISQKDDMLGYIQIESSGQIAQVGTLCKVVERYLLEDGRQIITLEGRDRFKVRRILKTLPYVTAEVNLIDDDLTSNSELSKTLEREVYDYLKYYVRITRAISQNKDLVLSASVKKHRPTRENVDDHIRRSKFSLAVCNLIVLSPRQEQQLLQTTSSFKRLNSIRIVLKNLVDYTTNTLIKEDVLSAAQRDEIKFKAFNNDEDSDILPADVYEEEQVAPKDEWDISNME